MRPNIEADSNGEAAPGVAPIDRIRFVAATVSEPVVPVREENWGLAGTVRIASITPGITKNSREPWHIQEPVYPRSKPQEQAEPSRNPALRVVARDGMELGKLYRLQPVGMST